MGTVPSSATTLPLHQSMLELEALALLDRPQVILAKEEGEKALLN
mgnify:CR=1